MAKYRPTTKTEAELIRDLESRLGSQQFRTLLAGENMDLVKPERTRIIGTRRGANLAAGRGKITSDEAQRLKALSKNARAIEQLTARGRKLGHKQTKTNRAIRTWIEQGKGKDAKRRKDDDELRAIRALRFLGVDIDAGIFYLKGIPS